MDPQKLSQLDPKLRDAYQRVMGTPIPPPPPPDPAPAPTPPYPSPEPTPPPPGEPIPTIQEPSFPQPQPTTQEPAIPKQPPITAGNFVQMNSEVPTTPMPQAQTMTVKKKQGMMPVLFGVVGFIFVVIYTFFWAKIFNFQLPFLP